jgi:Putative prokaryotic signal transducing protein
MEDRWRVIYRASGMTNARIVAGRLETEEIPFRLKYEAAGEIYAIVINGLGEVEILVPEDYFEAAQKVLSTPFDEKDLNWQNTSE